MLAGCRAVINPLSPISEQLWTAWEALFMSFLSISLCSLFISLLLSLMCIYFVAAISEHQTPTPSCHLLIKAFFFSFLKAPSLHFPSGCVSQTHAVLNEKQPLTWGPRRPQHLNELFFLPPPFFAGHERHCQMLALINLIIRWATHTQARVRFALPAALLPTLISLCRQQHSRKRR